MKRLDRIKLVMERIAQDLNIPPQELNKKDITSYEGDITVSDWDFKQIKGGLNAVKKALFPLTTKDLVVSKTIQDTNKYIESLEKKLADKETIEYEIQRILTDKIHPVRLIPYKEKSKKPIKKHREVVCMMNDFHFGLDVKADEVGGINQYSWTEASRRTAFFIQEVCNYKLDKRPETSKVHLILNGDCIAGVIHGLTGRDHDLLSFQANGAIYILTHAITRLAESFKEVHVYYSVGNHGDMPHRREGGNRVSSQVYDNYESIIFYALSAAFRQIPSIQFHVSKTIYNDVYLPAGRLVFSHGHLLFSRELGNPGTAINVKNLSNAVMRFNNGEKGKGKAPAKIILLGHTHSLFYLTTPDGVQIYNAPSMSGVDPYALSLGIHHNLTAQLVFESTDKYILGDSRLVHVQEADSQPNLDTFIPIYKGDLKWVK